MGQIYLVTATFVGGLKLDLEVAVCNFFGLPQFL